MSSKGILTLTAAFLHTRRGSVLGHNYCIEVALRHTWSSFGGSDYRPAYLLAAYDWAYCALDTLEALLDSRWVSRLTSCSAEFERLVKVRAL